MARILIADDDRKNAELLEAHLDEFETLVAIDGAETLEKTDSWKPDLILLDVMMPKLSGFEVCKQIRATEAGAHRGIIMVTALDQATDIEKAIEAGADDFMTKPINRTELLARVHALLKVSTRANPVDKCLGYYEVLLTGPTAE